MALQSYSSANDIRIEPGTTVQVGEEVFFDGTGVTIPGAELFPNGMIKGSYEWDFGDGYTFMGNYPYPYYQWWGGDYGGTTISHSYMRPGTYTATLKITDINNKNNTAQTTITVTGNYPKLPPRPSTEPILELNFENNLNDISPKKINALWGDANPGIYIEGVENKAVHLSGEYIRVPNHLLLGGMKELTISLWAKRNTITSDYSVDTLLNKNGAYEIRIGYEAGHGTVFMKVNTDKGPVETRNFLADEIKNKQWHHYVMVYDGSHIRMFIDGAEKSRTALTGMVKNTNDDLLIGKGDSGVFDGCIDEVKIYNSTLTPTEISTGFELWHADIQARTAQYIYAQIPGVFTKNSENQIKVTIEGNNGYSKVILNKNNLQQEETFLLNNSLLPAGTYILKAQLFDAKDNMLDELTEKFEKPYNGMPVVGIDQNNAIRINGALFFPVTSWMLTCSLMNDWKARKCINTLCGEGYYPKHNIDSWKDYLNQASSHNWYAAGGEFIGTFTTIPVRNVDTGKIIESVTETKNHPNLLMWHLGDEPALANVPAPVLRSRTYLYHKHDTYGHPVLTNYGGGMWVEWGEEKRKTYEYLHNAAMFGGKRTHVTDVLGIDYYPIGFRKGGTTVEKLALALDRLREENYNLVPYMSFVETAYLVQDLPPPTAEQVRMLAWLNVVHGVKGINWYHYELPTPPENYAAMAEFTDNITRLTSIVLAEDTNRNLRDNANEPRNRVDTMIKEDDKGNIWLLAVRLTEADEANDPPIDVTFTLDGLTSNMTIIEPGEFSQSVSEYKGYPTESKRAYSFTLNNPPIIPGSVLIAGQYQKTTRGRDDRIYLYDDGNGKLYGFPVPWQYKHMAGKINYETGEVFVDFGQVKLNNIWVSTPILSGTDTICATYRPARNDRIIPHTAKSFTDTFAPNAVHIYKISKSP